MPDKKSPDSRKSPSAPGAEGEGVDYLFIVGSGDPSKDIKDTNTRNEINRQAQRNAYRRRQLSRQRHSKTLQPNQVRSQRSSDYLSVDDESYFSPQPSASSSIPGSHEEHFDPRVSPSLGLNNLRIAPVSPNEVTITAEMKKILSYYFTIVLPMMEPVQAERDEFSQWMGPMISSEPALLFSLLACMACNIQRESNSPSSAAAAEMASKVAMYRLQAVQTLKETLKDPHSAVKPSTLLAMQFLLWQELVAEGDSVHMSGMKRLLEVRKGFADVPRKGVEGVMIGCYWHAICNGTKPALLRLVNGTRISWIKVGEVFQNTDPELSLLGTALVQSDMEKHLDDNFILLLDDTRAAWICFEQIGIKRFSSAEKRHFTNSRLNADHRLLSYNFEHYVHWRPVQESIRRALIAFSNAHYSVVRPSSPIARTIVEDLKKALADTDLRAGWGSPTEDSALMWCLFMGAHMSHGQADRTWFVKHLTRVVIRLHLDRWPKIRAVLLRYYYTDGQFRESFEGIWTEVRALIGGR